MEDTVGDTVGDSGRHSGRQRETQWEAMGDRVGYTVTTATDDCDEPFGRGCDRQGKDMTVQSSCSRT